MGLDHPVAPVLISSQYHRQSASGRLAPDTEVIQPLGAFAEGKLGIAIIVNEFRGRIVDGRLLPAAILPDRLRRRLLPALQERQSGRGALEPFSKAHG